MIHNAPAVAIVLFGLALIYRDGALVIVAAMAAVLAIDSTRPWSSVERGGSNMRLAWLHR